MAVALESYFSPQAKSAIVGQNASAPSAQVAPNPSVGVKTKTPATKARAVTRVTTRVGTPNYSNYENGGGTIYNRVTGKSFSNQQELANELGTPNIDYSKIGKGVDYSSLQNREGTVYNTKTNTAYKTPEELAGAFGTSKESINWGNIPRATASGEVIPPTTNAGLYGQLINQQGTVINKETGQKYATPQDLSKALGTSPSGIEWPKIQSGTYVPKSVNYANYINENGAIKNRTTGKVFNNPTELALDMGIPSDSIQWNNIEKLSPKGTGNNPYTVSTGLMGELVTNLANKSSAPIDQYTDAVKNNQAIQGSIENINKQIADLDTSYANAQADIGSRPTGVTQQAGQEGLLERQYATKRDALSNQLAGLSTQYSANTAIINAANTQQQLQQAGLTSAAGLTQPQVVPYSSQYVSPLTGGAIIPNASSDMQAAVNNVAQQFKNGNITYDKAVAAISDYGQAGQNLFQQAIAGINTNVLAGQSAASTSNVQTAGTAFANTNQSIYANAAQKLADVTSMANNIKDFGSQLIQNMNTAGINPSDSQHVDETINDLAKEFNSRGYAAFAANLQGLQARVAALLGTGEVPSSATNAAQSIVNGNMTVGAMSAALNQINNEASAIVNNQASIAKSAYQNLQGASGGTSTGSGVADGTSYPVGNQSVVRENGKWVVK